METEKNQEIKELEQKLEKFTQEMKKESSAMFRQICKENASHSVDYEMLARNYLAQKYAWTEFSHQTPEEKDMLTAFCAGLALAGKGNKDFNDLKESSTYPDRLAIPTEKEGTAGYITNLAALKGLTPGQLIGKILDKFVEQYQEDGGDDSDSSACRPGTLGAWYNDMEKEKSVISWINGDYGQHLTAIFLDYYEDPNEDTDEELEEFVKTSPGHTLEEAKALLDLFSAEMEALKRTERSGRKEVYTFSWEKQPLKKL